jgi:hypothetical protein
VEIQDSMDKTNIFWHLALHPLGSFSHVVAYRSSSKNKIKMKIQPILYKNLPWAHMELGFDVLGVAKKLVKYVVHLLKENLEKKNPFFIGCPNNKPIKFLCFFDKMMQFVTYNQTPFMSLLGAQNAGDTNKFKKQSRTHKNAMLFRQRNTHRG